MDDDEEGLEPPLPPAAHESGVGPLHHPSDGSPPRYGEELRISPNKNRLVQVRRTGGRKLFDKARKEVFLTWLAATCNIALAAEQAGICYSSVFRHREKDPAFAEGWDRAIAHGYARIEARELQEAHQLRIGTLPEEVVEEHFDPQLALHLLREHARRLPGSPDKRKRQRTTAETATNKEIFEELTKRLKGFALRVQREEAKRLPGPDGSDNSAA